MRGATSTEAYYARRLKVVMERLSMDARFDRRALRPRRSLVRINDVHTVGTKKQGCEADLDSLD